MAKSKIIKEFINEVISLEVALKRLKVILSDLNDPKLLRWVTNELRGYVQSEEIPEYRKDKGILLTSYVAGGMNVRGASVPIEILGEELQETLLNVTITDGVGGVIDMIEKDKEIGKVLNGDLCAILSQLTGVAILEARVVVSKSILLAILNNVSDRVLEIMIELERQFGVLDDLDIIVEGHNLEEVKENLRCIVFQDNSIKVGDKNKLQKSGIVSKLFKGDRE